MIVAAAAAAATTFDSHVYAMVSKWRAHSRFHGAVKTIRSAFTAVVDVVVSTGGRYSELN